MASKTAKPKNKSYGIIQRGCSLTIPVIIKDAFEKPLDLTDCMASFTVKQVQSDYDAKDLRAFIHKDFVPQEPLLGRFFVQLSSEDTDIPPGEYYFDVEITQPLTGMVSRLCTLTCEIEGGPTNRSVNAGTGQLPVGDEISIITLEQGAPIVIVAPAVAISPNIYGVIDELVEEVAELREKNAYQDNAIQVLNEHVKAIEEFIGMTP